MLRYQKTANKEQHRIDVEKAFKKFREAFDKKQKI